MFGKKKAKTKQKEKAEDIKLKNVGKDLPASKRLAELEAEIALKEEQKISNPEEPRQNNMVLFWIVLCLTVILAKLPFSEILFTPLNQFATMIHEMSHAIMCILTGGNVSGMTIVSDGHGHGGLTFCHGGIPFIHVQAGYIGTAVVGCALILLGQFKHLAKPTLVATGIITALGALIFMGAGLFSPMFLQVIMSIAWAAILAALTIYAGLKLSEPKANFVLLFIAIHTSLDSLKSIGIVMAATVFATSTFSDATIMQKYYFLPAIVWSLIWAALSIAMVSLTLWYSYGKNKK